MVSLGVVLCPAVCLNVEVWTGFHVLSLERDTQRPRHEAEVQTDLSDICMACLVRGGPCFQKFEEMVYVWER